MGEGIFFNCINLTEIVLPDGVKALPENSFNGCSSLKSINLEKLTAIGASSFWACNSLESVEIPEGMERIEAASFGACASLSSVKIGKNIKYIGLYAFNECPMLTVVNYAGSEADFAQIELENGVEAIGFCRVEYAE